MHVRKISPISKIPMKKRTIIMTNHIMLSAALEDKCCDGSHSHLACTGFESGYRLSTWCQVYPPKLCTAIAKAALSTSR